MSGARMTGTPARCAKHGCTRNARAKCELCGRSFCGDSDHIGDATTNAIAADGSFAVIAVRACSYCVGVGRAKRLERAS